MPEPLRSCPSMLHDLVAPSPHHESRPPVLVMGIAQEWAARSLETVLAPAGFAVVRAYTGTQALDLAEVAAPDLIVIDSRLPDMDGVDVIQRLRDERRIGGHVPVVLTTSGPATRALLVSAFSLGAWTVWEQPIDAELMLLRLRTWVQAKRAVDAAEQAKLIELDTGMYTARGLQRRAREFLADANRRKTPVSCVAITPVVAARADQPLELLSSTVTTAVASTLQRLARGSDVLGRSGAQEFAILAPTTTDAGARELVERLRDAVTRIDYAVEGATLARVDLRAGIATLDPSSIPWHGEGGALLSRAATALRFAHSSRSVGSTSFDEVPATFV